MKKEFEFVCLELLLEKLLREGYLKNEEQKLILYKIYSNDNRDFSIIYEEIKRLRVDKTFLEQKLMENEKIVNKDAKTIDLNKKVDYPLSLENVTDFEKDGKNYTKIHYPAPYDQVRIIENMTDPYKSGKEIFESLKDSQKVMSLDGEKNATSIFEQVLLRDCREVKLKDIKDVSTSVEYEKLSLEERKIVYGCIKAIISSLPISDEEKRNLNVNVMLESLNKKIYLSPEENIVVICEQNNPSRDEVKTLKADEKINSDGSVTKNYTLKPLNETSYRYGSEEGKEEATNTAYDKQREDDLEKEMGTPLKPKAPWQKRKKNQAAFISVLWFSIFAGVLAAVISIISIFKVVY